MIVAASAASSLLRLEPLARRIFGEGDRPRGWFQRKLERECVDPMLSRLLHRDGMRPDDPDAWLGYALVGLPPSLPGTARTAGIGLVPEARGRGHGLRLVHAVVDIARERGAARLLVPSELPLVPFYARVGLRERTRVQTLLHFGSGSTTRVDFGAPAAWDDARGTVVGTWLREAWDRTDPALRGTARLGGTTFHLAREGIALVCHRCVTDSALAPYDAAATFDALREQVRDGTPLIVVHGDAVSSITAALRSRGWSSVQDAALLERELRVDKGAAAVDDDPASYRRLG